MSNKLILTEGMLTIEAAQAADDGKLKPRRFDMVAYSGDVMRVAGWGNPLVVDLQGLQIAQNNKPIFLGHSHEDIDSLIGQTDLIRIADGQLKASGQILGHSDKVKQVLDLHDSGFKWQASIGARAEKHEFLGDGMTAMVNGRKMTGPLTIVRKSTLGEISFVMLGADESTSAAIAANNNLSFKEPTMANENQPSVIEAAAVPDVQDIRAKHAAEYERIAAIEKIAGITPDITAKAIKDGWDVTKAELEVLRASLLPPLSSSFRWRCWSPCL